MPRADVSRTPDVARDSAIEQPQKCRYDHADQNHGGDRKIEGESLALDDDITRQVTERQFGKPGPQQPDDHDGQTDEDEAMSADKKVIDAGYRASEVFG